MPTAWSAPGTRRRSRRRPVRRRVLGAAASCPVAKGGREILAGTAAAGSATRRGPFCRADGLVRSKLAHSAAAQAAGSRWRYPCATCRTVSGVPAAAVGPFLAAASGRRSPHTPVWFMRQAGRSLPEYRARARRRARSSTPSSSPTWPPRSRCSRCAAMASMPPCCTATSSCRRTPSASASTSRQAPDPWPRNRCVRAMTSTRLRPLEPDDVAFVAETVKPPPPPSSNADGAGPGLRRCPVHRRQLPDRGPAEPDVRAHQGAAADRRGTLARRHGPAGGDGRRLHRRAADPRRPGLPAVRLVGRHAVAAPTTSASCCPTPAGCSPSWPLATRRCPASISASAATTFWSRCGRPGLGSSGSTGARSITDARRRLGPDVVVQGNLDPALVLAGADAATRAARDVLADNGGHPGHVFNLGHGVLPTRTPACLAASSNCPRRDRAAREPMLGVRVHGLRHTACAGGDRGLLHRHQARPAADAGAAGRPDPPLRGDRRTVAAGGRTEAQRDALAGGARRHERRAGSSCGSGSSTPTPRSRPASRIG